MPRQELDDAGLTQTARDAIDAIESVVEYSMVKYRSAAMALIYTEGKADGMDTVLTQMQGGE